MKVTNDVINVLANCTVSGNNLCLGDIQLERKLYVSVDKVLKALGGKWNRKAGAHVFDSCPNEKIEQLLYTGEYTDVKKEFQFFETPQPLAQRLIHMACVHSGETVLEPSAGQGAIAKFIDCDVIELNESNRTILLKAGFFIVGNDFLQFNNQYDVIIANPPFSKQQDIDHVNHMLDLAKRCVVSVMSASVLFRDNKKTVLFRERIENLGGEITPLPDDSFVTSGTKVKTCVVKVIK